MAWAWLWLAAIDAIFRIAIIAVSANTEAGVILRLTFGVRAAAGAFANISTLRFSVLLNTLGRFRAIVVDLALDSALTADCVGVADVTGFAEAFVRSSVVFASGSGTTRRAFAEIGDVTSSQRIAAITRLALADLFVVLGSA